jgi:hypothetical protein
MVTSHVPWALSWTKPNAPRNVYLVLKLTTGCVSPQFHCRFDDFFETTRHGGPDVSGTISWQQLAGLDRTTTILSEVSAPIQHGVMYPESLSEGDTPPEEPTFSPPVFDVTSDDYSISDRDSHVTENTGPSCQSRAPLQAEGVTPAEHPVTAGTSQRGRVRTMSRRIAESIAHGLHHMAHESIMGETEKDQIADVLTKALAQNDFQRHRRYMCGKQPTPSNQSEGVLRK